MYLNIKTGYTFKQVFGHLDLIAEKCLEICKEAGIKEPYGGIADLGNTFAHIPWRKACKKVGIKPIYGIQLPVYENLDRIRSQSYNWMTFVAKTQEGLQKIYELVNKSFEQFYYVQRITYDQINSLHEHDVIIIGGVGPRWDLIHRFVFDELSPSTPLSHIGYKGAGRYQIASVDNNFVNREDLLVYEPFADERLRETKSTDQHILSNKEWLFCHPGKFSAIQNLYKTARTCNVELPEAHMVKYIGSDSIVEWSHEGAVAHGIDIINPGIYKNRYDMEMELIHDKEYSDYFLVVADLIRYAKKHMAVGPARGSSAGSLVCFLLGITEIDPIPFGLYFERFIDINRFDLPDIDVDFQDDKRHLCIKYLEKKYGKDNVAQIGNINRFKPKSAIQRFAQSLCIPLDDVQELKDGIMEKSGGDARANLAIEDSFTDTEVGQNFIAKYPEMRVVSKIESHPSHTGVHAAGILVCNAPITNYCGINCRDKKRIGMLDKKDAEAINLLKIDALGLRTLTIIADTCDQLGKPYSWMYDIPTDDDATFKVFNDHRFNGIFQFEGSAIQNLAKSMPIESLEDVSALSALGRPGPLVSGGATSYIRYRNNPEEVEYLSDHPAVIDATRGTYGVMIYQEQMLAIGRNYGKLSWAEVSILRKAVSKSLGDEFFDKFKVKFIEGAVSQGETIESAEKVWKGMHSFGSWAFNKSHSVSYGLISYICAYLRAHYPLEFLVACLNHSKSDRSALKILRDAVENDGVQYCYFDIDNSTEKWSVSGGVLFGGLLTIHGIGPANARKILKNRREGTTMPEGLKTKITAPVSSFKYLYPAREIYGDYYSNPEDHNLNGVVTPINLTEENGTYTIIGCLIKKNLRDANEATMVAKRQGKFKEGETSWLNLTVEDDTGQIMAKIKIDDYERIGREIAETGKEEKDWYMIYGKKINGWSLLFVENIMKITRS